MTKVKDCFACNIGYKWNATNLACEVCGETNVCVKTGCESLAPAGNGSTTPAAANSALIVFIFTTFVALITLLI